MLVVVGEYLGIKFTLGAAISSSIMGTMVGFLTGYMTTKTGKLGAMIGGFGGVAAVAIGFSLGVVKAAC